MRVGAWTRRFAVMVAGVGMVAPQGGLLAQNQGVVSPVVDVIDYRMEANGRLVGEVRDTAGNLLSNRRVTVFFEGNQVATTTTNEQGVFQVEGLREGVHDVVACDRTTRYRLWQDETAPPQSETVARLVCGQESPVYQSTGPTRPAPRFGRLGAAFATYPIATAALLGAGLGTAIAVPIAVSNNTSQASP